MLSRACADQINKVRHCLLMNFQKPLYATPPRRLVLELLKHWGAVEVKLMHQELIRCPSFKIPRRQGFCWEILDVERNDGLSARANGRCKNMPILGMILYCRNQLFISFNRAIGEVNGYLLNQVRGLGT